MRVVFDPRPDYARGVPTIIPVSTGLQIGEGSTALYLRTDTPLTYLETGQPFRIDEPRYFALSYGKPSDRRRRHDHPVTNRSAGSLFRLPDPAAVEHFLRMILASS